MKKGIAVVVALAVLSGFAGGALFILNGSDVRADDSEDHIVVVLSGTAAGVNRNINGVVMPCFDVDLLDPESGESIGAGTDCLDLSSITPIDSDGDGIGDGGFEMFNTTFFHLDDGTIEALSRTSILPAGPGSPQVTHFTGAKPLPGTNQILTGTDDFEDAEGRVVLNGGVDMSIFASDGIITFDCVFRIELNGDDDDDDND